ncbi:XRE family transcriptional regulator [Lysinibacillus telephonicus]|uniref:XRE family transcriptional regulator n=1 Tax=Lysinibacillus telephonicus TaxID=1714840 RepID=UPI0031FD8172
MNEKDVYVIKRRKKKIRLREIANFIDCSISLLSKYENDLWEMSENKVAKYRKYIDSK